MVLQACSDFALYARHGISNWRDLMSVAETIRGAFGISPSAWAEAVDSMGAEEACVALAAIVQRSAMIKSPGGYLRNLTGKARAGKFSTWPMLMALWRLQHGQSKPK
jgi:replication initiation protein RepC